MSHKLLTVSVALSIWKGLLRLSDRLTSNQWISLCSINLALIATFCFFYFFSNTVYQSETRPHVQNESTVPELPAAAFKNPGEILLITVSACETGSESLIVGVKKPNNDSTASINPSRLTSRATLALHLLAAYGKRGNKRITSRARRKFEVAWSARMRPSVTVFSRSWNAPVMFLGRSRASAASAFNGYVSLTMVEPNRALNIGSTKKPMYMQGLFVPPVFAQDDGFPDIFKVRHHLPFLPRVSSQDEYSFLREAVFYAPLVMCLVQAFASFLTLISLHRKWGEGVQLKLTNEKLRLEIEKLKEERNKGTPQIIITDI